MKTIAALIKRNVKMYFKDKGMFFSSLITPIILLVLYVTFLKNVRKAHMPADYGEIHETYRHCRNAYYKRRRESGQKIAYA